MRIIGEIDKSGCVSYFSTVPYETGGQDHEETQTEKIAKRTAIWITTLLMALSAVDFSGSALLSVQAANKTAAKQTDAAKEAEESADLQILYGDLNLDGMINGDDGTNEELYHGV